MSDFTDQLRTALREAAGEVDAQVNADQLSTRIAQRARSSRRRSPNRAWIKPALAAVAVATLAGAVAAITVTHGPHKGGVATQPPSPATSTAPTPDLSSSTVGPPPTSASGSTTPASTATQCLTAQQAIAQFVPSNVTEDTDHGYQCDSGWLYVNYRNASTGNHSTLLLQSVNGHWTLANRLTACPSDPTASPMPADIYEYGCGS